MRSVQARRYLREAVRRVHGGVMPVSARNVVISGAGSLRVTLLGGGVAVGYGARTLDEALDGQLARRIAAGSDRGVVLENLARNGAPLQKQVYALAAGLEQDIYVCAPTFESGLARVGRRGPWLLTDLHDIVPKRARIVALELPDVIGGGPAAELARSIAQYTNRRTRAAARLQDRTVVVAPPSVEPAGDGVFTAASGFYDALALSIGEALR